MDVVDAATRSRMMAGIRAKDTRPEMIVRKALHRLGLRYRLHVKTLPGKPDLVFSKYWVALFVHGCFWHRHNECRFAYIPKTNREFWVNKFDLNQKRDNFVFEQLHALGWRVLIVWECQIKTQSFKNLVKEIKKSS